MQLSAHLWGIVANIVFQGPSALTLDGKGRIAMPARHREVLAAMGVNQLTVTKHPEGSLMIFPRPAWEVFREKVAGFFEERAPAHHPDVVDALCGLVDSGRLFLGPMTGRAPELPGTFAMPAPLRGNASTATAPTAAAGHAEVRAQHGSPGRWRGTSTPRRAAARGDRTGVRPLAGRSRRRARKSR